MLHEVSKIDPHAFCFDVCMLFGKIWMLSLIVCCPSAVIVAACFELSTRSSGLTHKKRDLILDWCWDAPDYDDRCFLLNQVTANKWKSIGRWLNYPVPKVIGDREAEQIVTSPPTYRRPYCILLPVFRDRMHYIREAWLETHDYRSKVSTALNLIFVPLVALWVIYSFGLQMFGLVTCITEEQLRTHRTCVAHIVSRVISLFLTLYWVKILHRLHLLWAPIPLSDEEFTYVQRDYDAMIWQKRGAATAQLCLISSSMHANSQSAIATSIYNLIPEINSFGELHSTTSSQTLYQAPCLQSFFSDSKSMQEAVALNVDR